MLWLLDTLEVPAMPAALGGLLFGFSSYELAEMRGGHIFLILTFPIPLLVGLFIRRLRGQLKPTVFVAHAVFASVPSARRARIIISDLG